MFKQNVESEVTVEAPVCLSDEFRALVAAETPFSSGGSRHNSQDESEDEALTSSTSDKSQITPKARPFRFYQNSPKKREFLSELDSLVAL